MATPQNNPRRSQGEEAAIQQRVQSEWGNATASGNPQLYFLSRGIIPGGYKVDATGKLNYVQVDQSRPGYLNPKIAIPSILGAGLAAPFVLGGSAAAGAAGAAGGQGVATGLPTLASTAYPALATAGPSLAGASTMGGTLAGGILPPLVKPPLATLGGGFGKDLLQSSLMPGINAGLNYFAGRAESKAAQKAADAQIKAANYAAELAAKGNADALAFLKENETRRRLEHDQTQALNLDQYNQQLARTAPYRTLGGNAVASLARGLSSGNGAQYLPGPTIRRTLG